MSKDLTDNDGVPVKLYRSGSYWEDINVVIMNKVWIGAVEVGGKESRSFPGVLQGKGCVAFQANAVQGAAKDAELYDARNNLLHTFKGKWLCIVPEHGPEAAPQWQWAPENCTRAKVWMHTSRGVILYQTPKERQERARPIVRDEFSAGIEKSLMRARVSRVEIKMWVAMVNAGGPWYPCAQTGCCRVLN